MTNVNRRNFVGLLAASLALPALASAQGPRADDKPPGSGDGFGPMHAGRKPEVVHGTLHRVVAVHTDELARSAELLANTEIQEKYCAV